MSANFLIIGCGSRDFYISQSKKILITKYIFIFLTTILMFMANQTVIKFSQEH